MSYSAKVVADSMSPHGVRLTTIVATFPRFILAEVNTHRVFSRNSASSRAIPPEKMIARVRSNPFVPEVFRARVKGMGQGDALDDAAQRQARYDWIYASHRACEQAEHLMKQNVSKAHVNRLLEPFLWHTAIITSTEWSNFFALRQPDNDDPVPQNDHGAQPEFQIVARMMRDAMQASMPDALDHGDWHLPFVDPDERASSRIPDGASDFTYWAMVSAGRCFVVSYDKLDEIMDEHHEKSAERAERGRRIGHWSPLEHPARPADIDDYEKVQNDSSFGSPGDEFYGNLRGWVQLRKMFPNEDDAQKMLVAEADGRISKTIGRPRGGLMT